MTTIPLLGALIAGIVSFLSPCILPIIPGFLAYLAGDASDPENKPTRRQIFMNSVFFVIGFSAVFAVIGILLNTVLSSVAYDAQVWLARIGGVVIIVFGLFLAGLLKIGFLNREHKITVKKKFKSKYLTSFVFGSAFAAGWTPCVGAILGAILGLAAAQPGIAFWLLLSYAVGLGIPFLIVGAFTSRANNWIARLGTKLVIINKIFGVVLIVLGILVFTQQLQVLSNFELVNKLVL